MAMCCRLSSHCTLHHLRTSTREPRYSTSLCSTSWRRWARTTAASHAFPAAIWTAQPSGRLGKRSLLSTRSTQKASCHSRRRGVTGRQQVREKTFNSMQQKFILSFHLSKSNWWPCDLWNSVDRGVLLMTSFPCVLLWTVDRCVDTLTCRLLARGSARASGGRSARAGGALRRAAGSRDDAVERTRGAPFALLQICSAGDALCVL
jgi:hypothetical protein